MNGSMRVQSPSMGRIVRYNHTGSKDGKYPPMQSPAIIMKVWEDGTCDLFVMSNRANREQDSGQGTYFARSIPEWTDGGEPNVTSWSWPPRD